MTDKVEPTLGDLKSLITEYGEQNKKENERLKIQMEQMIFRLECIYTGHAGAGKLKKKTKKEDIGAGAEIKNNKKVKKKTDPNVPYNTMYWWKMMYMNEDPAISEYYTDEDVETAKKIVQAKKKKPKNYDEKTAISIAIWSTFSDDKKKILKTKFDNWLTEQHKANTVNVEKDPGSDADANDGE